jgi:hypothetical protein
MEIGMRLTLLILCNIILISTAQASAIPPWILKDNSACYSFTDVKTLLTMDAELSSCKKQLTIYPDIINELTIQINDLNSKNLKLVNYKNTLELEHRKALQELSAKKINPIVPLAGSSLILITGIIIGLLIH